MITVMETKDLLNELVARLGGKFSGCLGIKVNTRRPGEIFKWFLASKLFGARISETIAVNTYRRFERERVLTPEKILNTGWDGLVKILDEGGYVRYDFSTATKLLEIMKDLMKEYRGDLNKLHTAAKDPRDLETRLQDLGKGIGEVTTNIFLRELRGIWEKAEPAPGKLTLIAARNLGLVRKRNPQENLEELRAIWNRYKVKGKDFADFEAALVRLAKDWCRKSRCELCPVKVACRRGK